jgi:GTP cyclohydrolase II
MHIPALEGFGLEIVEQVPIPVEECQNAVVSGQFSLDSGLPR